MREIVLDTETTGLDPYQGHRLVEIGCIELINRFPTGKVFHKYLNPERDMPAEAFDVHGLSAEFLQGQAVLPRGLRRAGRVHRRCAAGRAQRHFRSRLPQCRARALQESADRPRAPGRYADAGAAPPSGRPERLDHLCQRYGIDNSRRTKHGALLDAELLAEVYIELIGGRQASLMLVEAGRATVASGARAIAVQQRPVALPPRLSRCGAARRTRPSSPRSATRRSGGNTTPADVSRDDAVRSAS